MGRRSTCEGKWSCGVDQVDLALNTFINDELEIIAIHMEFLFSSSSTTISFNYVKRLVHMTEFWREDGSSVITGSADESLFCSIGRDAPKDDRARRLMTAQYDFDAVMPLCLSMRCTRSQTDMPIRWHAWRKH